MNHCSQPGNNQLIVDSKVQSFYIRTLCSYEPYLDKGLPGKGLKFKPGDLLLVLNANDDQWWQAVPIRRNQYLLDAQPPQMSANNSGSGSSCQRSQTEARGLIPSVSRVQSKSQSQRRHVEFDTKAVVIGPTGKLVLEMINNSSSSGTGGSSSFDLRRLRKFQNATANNRRPLKESLCNTDSSDESFILPYEIIEQRVVLSPRPVVVIGPGKDILYEFLLLQYPEKFNTPIPHTTRPPRPGEKEGVDYYFVANREELEETEFRRAASVPRYIDVGKFKGNLYANSVESIVAAIGRGRQPLLDISHSGIEKLRSAGVYPICILVSATTMSQCRVLQQQPNSRHEEGSVGNHTGTGEHTRSATLDVQSLREYTSKLEKEFAVLFDVIISPSSIAELQDQVLQLINAYQKAPTWVRADNQSFS